MKWDKKCAHRYQVSYVYSINWMMLCTWHLWNSCVCVCVFGFNTMLWAFKISRYQNNTWNDNDLMVAVQQYKLKHFNTICHRITLNDGNWNQLRSNIHVFIVFVLFYVVINELRSLRNNVYCRRIRHLASHFNIVNWLDLRVQCIYNIDLTGIRILILFGECLVSTVSSCCTILRFN